MTWQTDELLLIIPALLLQLQLTSIQ